MAEIMIDLETMGTGKDAAFVAIGAVRFDMDTPLPMAPSMGSPIQSLKINVDLQSVLDLGMRVDGSTISWWLEQSAEARAALFNPEPVPVLHALKQLKAFIDWRKDYVWAKGPGFDLAILSTAYRFAGDKYGAFSFGREMCVRTIMRRAGVTDADYAREDVAHSALDDAWHQARVVQECWKRIGEVPAK